MAGITHGVAGATPDELTRTLGSTGVHNAVITTTANGTPFYAGPDDIFGFRLIIAGAVTGSSPTLDIAMQICSDAAGTGATTVASFPQQNATMAVATGSLAAFPRVVVRTTAAKPYIRVAHTIGGTGSPTFNTVSVVAEPMPGFAP